MRGVHWDYRERKWKVVVARWGKRYYAGRFSSLEEATVARENKAKEIYGEFSEILNQRGFDEQTKDKSFAG